MHLLIPSRRKSRALHWCFLLVWLWFWSLVWITLHGSGMHKRLKMNLVMLFVSSSIFLTIFPISLNLYLLSLIDENVLGYIPFYILYYMMLTLQLVFAQTALGLGRRYSRLNNGLKNVLKTGKCCVCVCVCVWRKLILHITYSSHGRQ